MGQMPVYHIKHFWIEPRTAGNANPEALSISHLFQHLQHQEALAQRNQGDGRRPFLPSAASRPLTEFLNGSMTRNRQCRNIWQPPDFRFIYKAQSRLGFFPERDLLGNPVLVPSDRTLNLFFRKAQKRCGKSLPGKKTVGFSRLIFGTFISI